jgi:5-methylcytosine-specific restriction endonuclease McrA
MSWYERWPEFGPLHYAKPLGSGRRIPAEWRKANVFDLADRDGWSCAYCGCEVEVKEGWRDRDHVLPATVDHVVPRKRHGGDTNYNAVISCMPCNSKKSTNHPSVMFQ